MGAAESRQFDIGTLELAFWYARLMQEGNHMQASSIAPQLDPQLLTAMTGAPDHGLSMVQDLIMAHPQAAELPYFGDPASDETLQRLLRIRGRPGPTGDVLLDRQIQVAARADGDGGAAYVEQRIAQQTVGSYVTRRPKLQAPGASHTAYEDWIRQQDEVQAFLKERHREQGERYMKHHDDVRDAVVQDRARYDPRVMTSLQNAAVRNILKR